MEFTIKVENWELDKIIRQQITESIKGAVGELLTAKLPDAEIASQIGDRIRYYLLRENDTMDENSPLAKMLDEMAARAVEQITDDELKNAIMGRLINKLQSR